MDSMMDSLHSGGIKRIRQACANCRRKKTKCTGERPICFYCRRARLSCVYEPYSVTTTETHAAAPVQSAEAVQPVNGTVNNAHAVDNTELLQRIRTIEAQLARLRDKSPTQSYSDPFHGTNVPEKNAFGVDTGAHTHSMPPPSLKFNVHSSLPPPTILRSVINTYFRRVHNQPYSYFHETSFWHRFDNGSLPNCLILAILASGVRFSSHEYFAGKTREASEKYVRDAWLSVLTEHLTVEENLNVHVVQTVILLAVVDYTAGRVSAGWLKTGLAARISQDLHLMAEPDPSIPLYEQEERRRAFWSAYLIDRLISSGRSRPHVIHDEDCNLQVPCDEKSFRDSQYKKTNTLEELLNWKTTLEERPSGFGLVIMMASIFGRCTRYVHQNRKQDEIPPWDPQSEFAAINSSLLLLESYSNFGNSAMPGVVDSNAEPPSEIDHEQTGHVVFAHTLFHLCHCLLNHPFLVRLRLKSFGSKAPVSFSTRSLQLACDHAKQLIDLLDDAAGKGFLVESSFYAYCIAVAGGIHSLASHFEHQSMSRRQSDILRYYQQSVDSLERLAKLWTHADNILARLREFHEGAAQFASLLDPACLSEDLGPAVEEVMWSMIDYRLLGAKPAQKPLPSLEQNGSSPNFWSFGTDTLATTPSRLHGTDGDIFAGLSPNLRLNDIEYLLECSPRDNGVA